jgi:hypothetical protein
MDATGFKGSEVIDGQADEIEAIATELGVNPSGASATVVARLDGVDTALSGKAATVHSHATSDVTGLDTALAGKASSSHSHVAADVTDLGDAATLDVGTTAGTVAAGDHTHSGVYDPAGTAAALVDDLSGVTDAAAARTNLGLGSAALLSTSDVDERARDALGSALVAGTGMTVTPNDGADTITVATSAVLPTLVDAKGDLLVGTAADTVARLGVGTDGQVLTADSAAASGVKWAAAAAGGALDVRDEGTSLTSAATRLDFVGPGVAATEPATDQIQVLVPGLYAAPAASGEYALPNMYGSSTSGTKDTAYFIPVYVAKSFTMSNVAIRVNTVGAAGSVVRIGVYDVAYAGAPYPDALLSDLGTVATSSGTGLKYRSGSYSFTARTDPYWICIVPQVATAPVLVGGYLLPPLATAPSVPAMPFASPHEQTSGFTGALPSSSGCTFASVTAAAVPYLAIGRA